MINKLLTVFITVILISCNSKNSDDSSNLVTENQVVNNADSIASCSPRVSKRNTENGLISLTNGQIEELSKKIKTLNPDLPTIGVLMYDDVLTTELTAPIDVFTKLTEDGKQLFNVITIAESYDFIVSEEGLKMFPDYILTNTPKLDILIVPSA